MSVVYRSFDFDCFCSLVQNRSPSQYTNISRCTIVHSRAEFEEEDERLASEANAAKPSATKDTSPSPSDEERSSKSSEEESSFGGDN